MTLGARRSRILGAIWSIAGVSLLAGAVLLWIDRQMISVWEIPVGIVATWIGVHLWSQRVSIDRHGLTLSSMTGTERILWAGIASVDVQSTWWRPAVTIARKGNGKTTSIRTTSGLTRTQRDHLFAILFELSREHGFVINRAGRDHDAHDHEAIVGIADGLATIATEDAGPTEVDQEVDSDDDTAEQDETIPMAPLDLQEAPNDDITEEMVVPVVDHHPPGSGSTLDEPEDVDYSTGNVVNDEDDSESDTSPQ